MRPRGGSGGVGGGWEDWANLSSEILVLVIKKVQERAAEDNGEMRRVVALAGVCRGWRLTILSLLAARPFSATGLLQFPNSLREAGPMDKPVQCVMRRKGGQFFLYQSDCDSRHVQELHESKSNFLMGACKRWRPGHIMFMLSSSRTGGFSSKSAGCMGKLRSNFWGTAFVLWDFQSSMTSSSNGTANYYHPGGGGGGGGSKCSRQKPRPVTFVRFSEEMVDGVKKRKMTCVVRTPKVMTRGSASSSSSTALTWCPSPMTSYHHYGANSACFSPVMRGKTFWKWSCMSTLNKSIRSVAGGGRPKGYLSLREEIIKSRMEEHGGDESPIQSPLPPRTATGGDGLLAHDQVQTGYGGAGAGGAGRREVQLNLRGVPGLLKNRQKVALFTGSIPEWDVRRKCWSLDFKGRATLPSMHNFQLLMPSSATNSSPASSVYDVERTTKKKKTRRYPFYEGSAHDDHRHHQQQQHSPAHAKQQTVVMQLGKIGKGLYALEFRSPLSAFQAFNIALSSFATTIGVEP